MEGASQTHSAHPVGPLDGDSLTLGPRSDCELLGSNPVFGFRGEHATAIEHQLLAESFIKFPHRLVIGVGNQNLGSSRCGANDCIAKSNLIVPRKDFVVVLQESIQVVLGGVRWIDKHEIVGSCPKRQSP